MKYMVLTDYDYLTVNANANFEIPTDIRQKYFGLLTFWNEEYYDGTLVDFLHKNFEIFLKCDIDLFVYVQDGEIYVREKSSKSDEGNYITKIKNEALAFYGKMRKIINEGEKK